MGGPRWCIHAARAAFHARLQLTAWRRFAPIRWQRFGRRMSASNSRMGLPPQSKPWILATFPDDSMYERILKIGQGTFGQVHQCRAPDGTRVAIKALKVDGDKHHGFSVTSVREIQILQRLSHENIISIMNVVASKDAHKDLSNAHVFVVFPYCEHDLSGLLDNPQCKITPAIVKCYFRQIVTGLAHLHASGILHRDIKCSNILIDNSGCVKLADFGLARPIRHDGEPYTDKVVTLWYRAPELLMGDTHYGPAIDVWSLGCVFGEMFTSRALFHGDTEMDQLARIFRLCGTPTQLPSTINSSLVPAQSYPRQIKKTFSIYGAHECDLLDRMLEIDPTRRITAADVLLHPYFSAQPVALPRDQVPKFTPSNELSAAKRNGLTKHRAPPDAPAPPLPLPPGKRPRSRSPPRVHRHDSRRASPPRHHRSHHDDSKSGSSRYHGHSSSTSRTDSRHGDKRSRNG